MHALFRLVDIVESEDVPTAAIEGGHAPRMLVNPTFAARYAATPERLLMLVMHELHHVILGHTRLLPVSTALDNIVFDAVINAMLCRAFPDPRGIALFTDFYAADEVPAALLRPAAGWEPSRLGRPARPSRALIRAGHPRLADVHRALYSPGGVSYEELRDALLEACPPAQAAEVALLGDHGAGGLMGGDLEARAPVLLDVVRQIVEEWPQPPEPDQGPVPRERVPRGVRAAPACRGQPDTPALAAPLGGRPHRAGHGPHDRPHRDHGPHAPCGPGRAATWSRTCWAARSCSTRGPRPPAAGPGRGSGSTSTSTCPAACRASWASSPRRSATARRSSTPSSTRSRPRSRTYSLADLAAGRIRTTGGTDVRCIAAHARAHHVRRAVVLTDGYVGRAAGIDAETLAGMRLAVAYTDTRFPEDLAPFAGRHDTLEVAS